MAQLDRIESKLDQYIKALNTKGQLDRIEEKLNQIIDPEETKKLEEELKTGLDSLQNLVLQKEILNVPPT